MRFWYLLQCQSMKDCANAQICLSLRCLHIKSMAADEDQNLDIMIPWICQHGHLLEAFVHMLQVPDPWVKVFRINPEFRILRLTFHRKSASKC